MPTDIKLDEDDGNSIALEATVVRTSAHDFILDSAERRKGEGGSFRRALVHDQSDGLTVNFNGDYPGGVTLNDVAQITPARGDSFIPELVVQGGISFQVETHSSGPGHGPVEIGEALPGPVGIATVSLDHELQALRADIARLVARVATLEARSHP